LRGNRSRQPNLGAASPRQRARDVERFLELELREELVRDDAVALRFGERLLFVEPFATLRTRDMRSSGNSDARLFAPSTTSLACLET
jgi:hypothetical protein